ncbi:hypothetical protein GGR32_001819 [Mesonia hippocampi]|uniref:Uncharacterized protein n=1 Tax=Mesonia hippocampi TaxID=1628250 RepID=A0A840EXF7_9FLAO|nr:hypothetical protein [Mesonia hippocampi]MBB4119517.1 hypothetical protein [Mesonia hippocampi]
MKWHFFYDESEVKSYKSTQDWYKDIKYLISPIIVMAALGLLFITITDFFIARSCSK